MSRHEVGFFPDDTRLCPFVGVRRLRTPLAHNPARHDVRHGVHIVHGVVLGGHSDSYVPRRPFIL